MSRSQRFNAVEFLPGEVIPIVDPYPGRFTKPSEVIPSILLPYKS